MPDLTPPPEHDPGPERRHAIRAALDGAEPGRRRTPMLAAVAVAAVLAAGIAIPQLRSDGGDDAGGPAGGPDPSTPVAKPGTVGSQRPATPKPEGPGWKPTKNPPKDPVKICRDTVAENGANSGAPAPARDAGVVVRLDGRWGVTLILSDGKLWVGCDTAHYALGGKGSILEPSRLLAPAASDGGGFAVSNVAVQDPARPDGPIYDHYWAAGMLPRGVAKIRYTFPDGVTKEAVVKDKFWIVEHLESKRTPPGQNQLQRDRIRVALARADGSVVRTHRLKWGEQTCAHVNHGC